MDESLWLLGLLSAAVPIVAVVASCIGYGVGSRQWRANCEAAYRREAEAEERAFQAEEKAFIEQASVEVQEEAVRLAAADEARATKMLDLAKRAAYHFTSDTITPRTEPLSDEELDALVQDDMDAMRDWRETSDQLDGPEKGGDQ